LLRRAAYRHRRHTRQWCYTCHHEIVLPLAAPLAAGQPQSRVPGLSSGSNYPAHLYLRQRTLALAGGIPVEHQRRQRRNCLSHVVLHRSHFRANPGNPDAIAGPAAGRGMYASYRRTLSNATNYTRWERYTLENLSISLAHYSLPAMAFSGGWTKYSPVFSRTRHFWFCHSGIF